MSTQTYPPARAVAPKAHEHFARHLAAARAASGADQKPAAEARAWQSLCQVWVMSSGFVYVD